MIHSIHKTLTTILGSDHCWFSTGDHVNIFSTKLQFTLYHYARVLSFQVTGRLDSLHHILPFALSKSRICSPSDVTKSKQEDFVYQYRGSFHNWPVHKLW